MDVLVPHNRWDLLPDAPRPPVSVVVTHYEQHEQLARVLAALEEQTLPPYEVVVADDGSEREPAVPEGVRLVRQEDLGFRAAAARNLGASVATGDALVFLDADTVPETGFLAAVTRRLAACRDVLAVGRRRHRDAGGELPEPAWLADAYAGSRNLLDADGRSFRFVISAVMACRRSLFEDLGGFDERFVGYGGEDWDLAYRAWNAGAVLVHERAAVAWHDGAEWAARDGDRQRKDAESLRLAALVPEPHTRGAPLPALLPSVLVDLDSDDVRAVHALLRQDHRDLQVRAPAAHELHAAVVRTQPWTDDQLRRAQVRVQLHETVPLAPHVLGECVRRLVEEDLGELVLHAAGRPVGRATTTRAVGRSRRWGRDVTQEAFGRRDVEVALLPPRDDLAGFFAL
jgi:cellulose synthase/poly-beta-1,6-N-acetylglucosamine synthase-like glycosyltransferase